MIFWRVGSLDLLGSLLLALDGSTLVLDALLSPLAGGLGLRTLGVHLLLDGPVAGLLGLGLVDLRCVSVQRYAERGATESSCHVREDVRAQRGHACA